MKTKVILVGLPCVGGSVALGQKVKSKNEQASGQGGS